MSSYFPHRCLLLLSLVACQTKSSKHDLVTTVPTPRPIPSHEAPVPTARVGGSQAQERQTLYPDTLQPISLTVTAWTTGQLDSMRTELEADTLFAAQKPPLWTNRYRVLYTGDDETRLHLFYRPLEQASQWLEIDLSSWQEENASMDTYIRPRAIQLDPQEPEQLWVQLGGGEYAPRFRSNLGYTLLISFKEAPQVIWYSLDHRSEEIPPYVQGQMTLGGDYADSSREIDIRQGLVYVSTVKNEGKFKDSSPALTPITSGSYRYQAGRFHRVQR